MDSQRLSFCTNSLKRPLNTKDNKKSLNKKSNANYLTYNILLYTIEYAREVPTLSCPSMPVTWHIYIYIYIYKVIL